ncbi:DUF4129 domain-containing protein [Indiicoccus explosivorum]|uniref:DUF4129 domain-containing protein n=1 Tax=Indiicoccus explosivorum TaxID=1917864 RepID=UPI000B4454D7|nr:DUF4129 domain-containing protein [Indiicoccus explosivorum]
MTGRLLSFNLFMLDISLIALPVMLISLREGLPAGALFLALSGISGLLSALLAIRFSYHPITAMVSSAVVMIPVLLFGGSVFLYVLFAMLVYWRLHARFSELQEETGNNYMLLFILIFPVSLAAVLVWGTDFQSALLYAAAFFALLFFLLSRLVYRYAVSADVPASDFWKAAFLLTAVPAAGAGLFFAVADWARVAIGTVLGSVLAFVLQPFDGVFEFIIRILEKIQLAPSNQEATANPATEDLQPGDMSYAAPEIPWGLIAVAVIIILAVIFLFWLRNWRGSAWEEKPAPEGAEVRFDQVIPADEKPLKRVLYRNANLPFIREAFRKFEKAAADHKAGRAEAETVREWFGREGWPADEKFHRIYDRVRYGDETISDKDKERFLNELEKLKSFFEK